MSEDDKSIKDSKKLGEYLIVSEGAIENLVKKQKNNAQKSQSGKRIGEFLVEEGILTQEELNNSLRQQRIARLAACPVFATLSSTELAALSSAFTEISYPPKTTFIVQGEDDPSLYIIATGIVEVFSLGNNGKEIHIAKVGAGAPIGEMGYFSDGIRAACVRTVQTTHLLQAQYKDLTTYFEKAQRVAMAFMHVIQQRQAEMEQRIAAKES